MKTSAITPVQDNLMSAINAGCIELEEYFGTINIHCGHRLIGDNKVMIFSTYNDDYKFTVIEYKSITISVMNKYNLKQGDRIEFINNIGAACVFVVGNVTDKSIYNAHNNGRNSFNTVNGYIEKFNGKIIRFQDTA